MHRVGNVAEHIGQALQRLSARPLQLAGYRPSRRPTVDLSAEKRLFLKILVQFGIWPTLIVLSVAVMV